MTNAPMAVLAPPPAEEETPSEPVEGVAEGDEQTEAPYPPRKRKRAINHPHTDPPGVKQGEMDDTWDEFE